MNIFQIKIDLDSSKPKITRTILVREDTTFYDLHLAIQTAMGWYNCHLHQFIIGNVRISHPNPYEGFEYGELNDTTVLLSQYLKEGLKLKYEYDFGDGWIHTLDVQKVLPFNEKTQYPLCIKGKNACPPEDCGGVWGYADLIETLKNPKSPDYEDACEWLGIEEGSEFDPTEFDLDATNEELADYKSMDDMDFM